jgi:hypothetical protein
LEQWGTEQQVDGIVYSISKRWKIEKEMD